MIIKYRDGIRVETFFDIFDGLFIFFLTFLPCPFLYITNTPTSKRDILKSLLTLNHVFFCTLRIVFRVVTFFSVIPSCTYYILKFLDRSDASTSHRQIYLGLFSIGIICCNILFLKSVRFDDSTCQNFPFSNVRVLFEHGGPNFCVRQVS